MIAKESLPTEPSSIPHPVAADTSAEDQAVSELQGALKNVSLTATEPERFVKVEDNIIILRQGIVFILCKITLIMKLTELIIKSTGSVHTSKPIFPLNPN